MKKMLKSRLLAMCLCLCMIVGIAPAAFAEEPGNPGGEPPAPVPVTGVTLDRDSLELKVGFSFKLTATVNPPESTEKPVPVWSSSNPGVADVVDGDVTAYAVGETVITAIVTTTDESVFTAACNVVVTAEPTPEVKLSSATLLTTVGGSATLSATTTPADRAVTWTSSDNTVATVTGGKVTGIKAGNATITATITVNSINYTATCAVTVSAAPPSIPGSASVTVNQQTLITISNLPTGATVSWKTSSASIASIPNNSTGSSVAVTGVKAGDATITATITAATNPGGKPVQLECAVKVVDATASTITYTVGSSETLYFDEEDFNDECYNLYGRTLNYVKFTTPDAKYGTLYYEESTKVSSSNSYYYSGGDSGKLYLSDISFVPKEDYNGSFSLSYDGWDRSGNTYKGTVRITVEDDSDRINYTVEKNGVLLFDTEDFNKACKGATGLNMEYVKFTLPSASKGTLYYDYNDGKYGSKVAKDDRYYRSVSPYLDYVSYVPANNVTGSVTINFSGKSTGTKTFSGKVIIDVGGESGDISYSADANTPITFDVDDFNAYCKSKNGANLDYVKFTVPNANQGILCYDYNSRTDKYESKVTKDKEYKRSSSPYLDYVTFIPKENYTGKVSIDFTGRDANNKSFSGAVALTFNATGNASVITYSSTGKAVDFDKSDFVTACENRGGSALASVKFSLPSSLAGTLYQGYNSDNIYNEEVKSTTSYDTGSGNSSISNVSFVPRAGYSGTLTISYTGTDVNGGTYTGSIIISVSRQFNDLNGYSWAEEQIYYLFEKDITQGTSDNTYNPGGNIIRGDFVLMLYRAFDLKGSSKSGNFSDVPSKAYYADAIAIARTLGIAQGGSDGKFRPGEPLTREDAMVLIKRTMDGTGKRVPSAAASALNSYPDGGRVSGYAQEPVADLVKAGVIKGDENGRLNPQGSLTRAEMAVILYRVLTL